MVKVDTATLPNGGVGLTNSFDPDGGTLSQSTVNLATYAGGIALDQDFGYAAGTPNTIAGTIWNDANADGVLDGGGDRPAGGRDGGAVRQRRQHRGHDDDRCQRQLQLRRPAGRHATRWT